MSLIITTYHALNVNTYVKKDDGDADNDEEDDETLLLQSVVE